MKLTKEDINKYYRLFSYVSIVLGVLLLFILNAELSEKILIAITINIVYHVFYFFPRIMEIHKPFKKFASVNLGKMILKIFTIFCFCWAFSLVFYIIYSIIIDNYYESLFIVTLPISFFLGSYSVWHSLSKK